MVKAALCFLGLVALAQPVPQTATGAVTGRIQDNDGGLIPGVTVYLENEVTQRKTISNSQGRYSFADIPPGTYRLEAELRMFRPFKRTDVVVTAGSRVTVDARLRINMGASPLSASGFDATDPVLARAVYEAVLGKVYRSASNHRSVVRTSLVPAVLPRAAWSGSFAAVAELRPRLEQAADGRPVFFRAQAFPAGVRLIGSAERYETRTSLTQVFFTADGRLAVVYYEHYCGNLCGEGSMVWLTRADSGVWQIAGDHTFWVS